MLKHIQNLLTKFDERIGQVKISFGPERIGDIKHSLASIEKAKNQLNYSPSHNVNEGIEVAIHGIGIISENN